MEPKDVELIERLSPLIPELKALIEEHEALERELEKYNTRRYLTSSEEMEKKRIQKLKLMGKDRIEEILSSYRRGVSNGRAG
ncbi:MAG: YdcH family protein [Thermodesulfobacteriota bacterium]